MRNDAQSVQYFACQPPSRRQQLINSAFCLLIFAALFYLINTADGLAFKILFVLLALVLIYQERWAHNPMNGYDAVMYADSRRLFNMRNSDVVTLTLYAHITGALRQHTEEPS